jgi:chaperonin cofactor prefoldin
MHKKGRCAIVERPKPLGWHDLKSAVEELFNSAVPNYTLNFNSFPSRVLKDTTDFLMRNKGNVHDLIQVCIGFELKYDAERYEKEVAQLNKIRDDAVEMLPERIANIKERFQDNPDMMEARIQNITDKTERIIPGQTKDEINRAQTEWQLRKEPLEKIKDHISKMDKNDPLLKKIGELANVNIIKQEMDLNANQHNSTDAEKTNNKSERKHEKCL